MASNSPVPEPEIVFHPSDMGSLSHNRPVFVLVELQVKLANVLDHVGSCYGTNNSTVDTNKGTSKGCLYGLICFLSLFMNIFKRLKKQFFMPVNVTSTTEEKVKLTLDIKTSSGKPAQVEGAPTWTVKDGNATVEPAEDGLSAYVISADEPGTSTIEVSADADLGEGQSLIVDSINYAYNHPQAAALGLTVGTPEPK